MCLAAGTRDGRWKNPPPPLRNLSSESQESVITVLNVDNTCGDCLFVFNFTTAVYVTFVSFYLVVCISRGLLRKLQMNAGEVFVRGRPSVRRSS